MLHAGVDVYTTVNVQHLEGLQDIVAGSPVFRYRADSG
ncbi:MAG: hypothetical protein ACLT16_10500 [[Clostridium] innocuum]